MLVATIHGREVLVRPGVIQLPAPPPHETPAECTERERLDAAWSARMHDIVRAALEEMPPPVVLRLVQDDEST